MSNPDASAATATSTKLNWGWMLLGVALGAILISSFTIIVWDEMPKPDVALLVGSLTFILTGIFVAYFSPGETILEPALAGIVLAALSGIILALAVDLEITIGLAAIGLPVGFVLALIGGWVGELLQGTLQAEEVSGLQWPWIAVGIVIGVVLNSYFVFVGRALFGLSSLGVLGAFAASFLLTGFFVGVFSPGVTLLEPALAGLGLILVDTLVTIIGFDAPFPLMAVLIAFVGAFFLTLLGGWVGEVVQGVSHAHGHGHGRG